MSGLAALFHRDDRPAARADVLTMLAAAPYRGPDGYSVHCQGELGLGHARLNITPEDEGERQPLRSRQTGSMISADVRLDNRADLLARLPGCSPCVSDAELILRTYEEWGEQGIAYLLGDFAFVLWDAPRQRLICARDTSGQRTLYYRADGRTFAAASEIQQLLQDPAVPIRPNDDHLWAQLVPLNIFRNEKDTVSTSFEGIFAVPAGHLLVVDCDHLRVQRYWDFEPPAELRYRTDEEYAEHYRALFFEVVRARLRSTHPLGVLLSGGLDSSSIACTAQRLYGDRQADDHGFTGFSFVFDGLACDERPFLEDMRAQHGFDVQYLSPGDYAGRLQLEPRGFRETPNMGVAGPRNVIFGAASRVGVRALLTGDIADGCVYGSRIVFDSLLRRGDLAAFLRHLRAYRRVSAEPLATILARDCLAPLLPLGLQKRLMEEYVTRLLQQRGQYLLPVWMPEPLQRDLADAHLHLCRQAEKHRRFSNDTRESEYRLLYPPEVARHPVPWPLEMWRPFADRRLHEFLLAIPPEQKFEPHPWTDEYYAGAKQVVRRAMRGILPESIRTRTCKTVFMGVWEQEIAHNWLAYAAAFGPSATPEIVRRGYVDQHLFWSRLQELRDRLEGSDLMYVFHMVELETWLRTFHQPRSQLVAVLNPKQDAGAFTRPPDTDVYLGVPA